VLLLCHDSSWIKHTFRDIKLIHPTGYWPSARINSATEKARRKLQ